MAAKNTDSTAVAEPETETPQEMGEGDVVETRTEPIDVTDSNQALSLLAAWQGVYNFFKGRVLKWIQDPDTGNVSAMGFTVDAQYDPQRILSDISGRDRRIDFPTALRYFNGVEPDPYENPNDMTNFTVNFTKGSVEGGTAKTPQYVRDAVTRYKAEIGLKSRRGRKRTILRLDDINSLDADALIGTDPEQLDRLIALAQQARATKAEPAAATPSA